MPTRKRIRRIAYAITTGLMAFLPFSAHAQPLHPVRQVTDVTKLDPYKNQFTWYQGHSVGYEVLARNGFTPMQLTGDVFAVWFVANPTNPAQVYIAATGTVVSATNGHVYTFVNASNANLAAGSYLSWVSAFRGASQAGMLAYNFVTVAAHPLGATYEVVEPGVPPWTFNIEYGEGGAVTNIGFGLTGNGVSSPLALDPDAVVTGAVGQGRITSGKTGGVVTIGFNMTGINTGELYQIAAGTGLTVSQGSGPVVIVSAGPSLVTTDALATALSSRMTNNSFSINGVPVGSGSNVVISGSGGGITNNQTDVTLSGSFSGNLTPTNPINATTVGGLTAQQVADLPRSTADITNFFNITWAPTVTVMRANGTRQRLTTAGPTWISIPAGITNGSYTIRLDIAPTTNAITFLPANLIVSTNVTIYTGRTSSVLIDSGYFDTQAGVYGIPKGAQ